MEAKLSVSYEADLGNSVSPLTANLTVTLVSSHKLREADLTRGLSLAFFPPLIIFLEAVGSIPVTKWKAECS